MAEDIELTFLTSTFFRRTLLVLLPFTAFVVYMYSELIFSSMRTAENRTVQQYLRTEYSLFERQFIETGAEQLPSTEILSAWWAGDQDLPASYAEMGLGVHLVDAEQHLLVAEPGGAGRRAYFVLTEPELGTTTIKREMESTIYLAAIVVLLSGGFLATIVGWLMSRPVRALANDVKSGRKPGQNLHGHDRNDEIGTLSREMGDLINRMDAALSREKAVTRYASHDMRTPVSIIRIAASVLDSHVCGVEKRNRNLKRIDDACADIEDLIEVHLCLAREASELPEETVSIRALVTDELAKHAHTIEARSLTTSVVGLDQSIRVARSMLRVILGNLIQNAVNYSDQSILVSIDADSIVIENSSDAGNAQMRTEGLGLEIVERVCDRLEWALTTNQEDDVFIARVQF